ncbi:MAG: tetratricopeptide repeat protein [Sphingomonadaceae bacterium]
MRAMPCRTLRSASPALLALWLALVPAAAAASVPRGQAQTGPHAYVQGRLAAAEDDLPLAARRFEQALAATAGSDGTLERRALDVALTGGDMKAAVRLARRVPLPAGSEGGAAGLGDSIVLLVRATDSMAVRDWRGYAAARQALGAQGRLGDTSPMVGALVEAWGLAGQGRHAEALAVVEAVPPRGAGASYAAEHRAHLLAVAGRWPEAADAYAALVAGEGAGVSRLRVAAAAARLEADRGEAGRSAASALLDALPGDPLMAEARARLAADGRIDGRRLGVLPARAADGLAILYFRIASDIARERALGAALAFGRLGTFAAPHMADGWLLVSDLLARSGKPELALAALAPAERADPWRKPAALRRAGILGAQERWDEARTLLAGFAGRPDATAEDWSRLADLERRAGRHVEAARGFAEAIARLDPAASPAVRGQLLFLEGAAHERAGDWPRAEAALRHAVELQPDNAVFLNYLGYSLLDRGLKLPEARALIARAFKAAPDNGAIIDSMGWAEFKAGNYEEAVRLLEQARAAEPGDPTIADHLGDALWRAGRRIEARHMWRSAAALQPEADLAERLAAKIDFGLDVALATARP